MKLGLLLAIAFHAYVVPFYFSSDYLMKKRGKFFVNVAYNHINRLLSLICPADGLYHCPLVVLQ